MSNIITLKDHPDLLNVVRAVSPRYRKHKAILSHAATFTPNGTTWDGGSRSTHFLVSDTHVVSAVRSPSAPVQFGGQSAEAMTIAIPRGHYVVTVGTFRGKTATVCITKNLED